VSRTVKTRTATTRTAKTLFVRGPLPILTAALLWGTTGTAAAFAPAGATPQTVGAVSLFLGGLLLFLTARGASRLVRTADQREKVQLLVGAAAVATYPVTFYPATARTGVAVATVVALGCAPLFVLLFSRSKVNTRTGLALGAAVTGCLAIVFGGGGGGTRVDPVGVLLALTAGFAYAVYASIGGRLIQDGREPRAVMGVLFGGCAVLVLPVMLVADMSWVVSASGAALACYLALFASFTAYTLYGFGLRHTPAAVATVLTIAEPAAAALLGIVVLGEQLSAVSWGGVAVLGLALFALV
jgi:DME family drug/metabolite transporter